tara:strand:- start:709 stop:5958 length:5250 start_codon:yes stop_codon:yes gene_type:complete
MATYKLYDIGTVSDSTYMYKGVYRVGTQLSSVTSYELLIVRFNLSDGSIDPNYGQQQQGAFRAHFQIKPNDYPIDVERLCPGIMFDEDSKLTFAGIAWMSGLGRHGFYIAKLDSTGNLSNYGTGNYGVSVGGFDTNIYSCTKELLVDKSNNCIFGVSTREHATDIASPSYISRRNNVGNTDNNFGNNGKVEIADSNFTPQITSLTFDNFGNYYVGYNSLKQDGSVFGNSYIKSYNYSGGENTYFSTNGKVLVDAGANFAAEAPQDLGSVVRDQYLNNVNVFLTMNSVNNATSLTDPVGSHNISFVGNAKISTDNKKFGSSSLRLDGINNSYLQIGTNNNPSDIPLNNEDFCIEMMLYLDAVDDGRRILSLGGNDSTNGLLIESLNSGDNLNSLRVMMGNAGNNNNVVNLVGRYCLVEKEWQHIAYVRQDNNVYLYVDGELKAASHYEGSVNLGNSGSLKLGADQNGENGMIGNIDDFRVTIGKSRYFNTFKVPEHQISNVGKSSDVKLLLHFEGDNNSKTMIDRGHGIMTNISALGNAEISSDKHKFGETSLKLDGTNSLVEVPNSTLIMPNTFYSNPFTIEGYYNFSQNDKTQYLYKKANSMALSYENKGTSSSSITVYIEDVVDANGAGVSPYYRYWTDINKTKAFSGIIYTGVNYTFIHQGANFTSYGAHPWAFSNAGYKNLTNASNLVIGGTQNEMHGIFWDQNVAARSQFTLSFNNDNGSVGGDNNGVLYWYCTSHSNMQGTWEVRQGLEPADLSSNTLKLRLEDTSSGAQEYEALFLPTVDQWYHIAMVKNGVNVSLYVDGVRVINSNYLNTIKASTDSLDIGANRAGGDGYMNGYVDEFRIVASAVYSGDIFTPAHHQFFPTQEHVITSNDNYANQVELLLHFEEANGSNLVDSSKSDYTVTLNQDGALNSTTSRFGNNSLSVPRLSGNSSSYGAKVNSNGSLNLTGNYTIETYFKLNSDVTEERVILEIRSDDNLSNSNPLGGFKIRLQQYTDPGSEPINVVYMGSGDLLPIRGANLYTKDTWYHIAVVRENSDVSCYLNGSLLLKKTFDSNIPLDVYGNVYLGGAGNGSLALDGVIDEVRITNGIARYTANFTPQNSAFGSEPVAAPEPQYIAADYSNSRLLLHFDSVSTNAISPPEDSSGNNVQCSVVVINDSRDAGRTSNLSKFGGKSWNMNANSNANFNNHLELTCDDSNLVLGTGDFTIELWIYKTSMENRHQTVLAMGINNEEPVYGGMPFAIYINNADQGGEIVASLVTSTGGNPSWRGPDFTPYLNQWVHLAFVRHNGVATFYLNGTSVDSKSNNANLTTSKLFIGGHNPTTDASKFFRGYIDELHIRDIAAYTQNFTPPNHAFGKQLQNVVQASHYYGGRSELAYMLPLTQTASFLAVAKKTNSDSTTYAEVLNIKHDGKKIDTWGDNGKIALTAPGYSYSNPETMWMDRELNLYVGGCAQKVSNGLKDGIVWKITPDGALDTTFGTNGVDIKDNTTLDESITSMYNDYDNNKMIYTSLFTGDSGSFTNHPMMIFDNYNFGGNLTFLSSYDYITKETTPSEGLNRVLQDMGLVNAAHIKMPASMFNNLLGTYNETTNKFPVTDIVLNVDQSANDNITVVSGGLIKDFWNYFIAKIETMIPADKRNLWDDSPNGANAYTDAKLQTFFRDVGLGTLTVPQVNDVIREYEASASSLFPYRAGIHRRQGFVAGDKAGINAGVQITFQTTISAATGGTASDTIIRETRTFNVLLELE